MRYAFRGIPCRDWAIETTLQHTAGLTTHDDKSLASEKALIESFRRRSWRFLGSAERSYLGVSVANLAQEDPAAVSLGWQQESIWGALAIARHYGVPTRLIDWTHDALIAAFFAAASHPDCDGAVWWFDQTRFEDAVHRRWDDLAVPMLEDGSGHRALALGAFHTQATPWIPKVHHCIPFHRMDVQRAFFTACGRLDSRHDQVMDQLDIPRGRAIVPRELKKRLLDELERHGLNASALDYPQADHIGWKLATGNHTSEPSP